MCVYARINVYLCIMFEGASISSAAASGGDQTRRIVVEEIPEFAAKAIKRVAQRHTEALARYAKAIRHWSIAKADLEVLGDLESNRFLVFLLVCVLSPATTAYQSWMIRSKVLAGSQ